MTQRGLVTMGIRPTRFGSRRLLAAALLSSMALVVVSSHDAQAGPPPIPIKPPQESQKSLTPEVKTPAEVTKPPVPGGMKPCADLAAQRIDFGIVSKTSQFKGRVRITGVVKNISPVAYSGTLTLNLFQKSQRVASQEFPHLNFAPGQEVTVAYERDWNASSSSEGEFPPSYMLRLYRHIKSDPECNPANNQLERSGSGINDLFK